MVQNRQKVKVNPFTFGRNLAIFGTFFNVHFLEKYTCNEAQTKLKTLFTALRIFFEPFKKISKMVQNRQKVKVNPFTFGRNLAIFETFFKIHFLEKYTSNEAQTNLKTLFTALRSFFEPFKKISKMVQNRQKVKVNPFTFGRNLAIFGTFFKVHFVEKYTSNEAQTKQKALFKA